MSIDIEKIAKLSRLRIEDEKYQKLEMDMKAIIEMFEGLPVIYDEQTPESCVRMELREDKAEEMKFIGDQLLANAPEIKSGCFCVPKAVEKVTE